jgi:hypothetical protein
LTSAAIRVLLLFMSSPAAPAVTGLSQTGLSHRLALILDGLCRVAGARGAKDRALASMMLVLWARLRRMAARFDRLAAQVRSANLAAAPAAPVSEPSAATLRPTPRAQRPRPAHRLPRGFAWLIRLAPEAACYGGQLQHMLADPEMAALLAAEPKLRRLLRPLCRMLAIRPGPELLAPLLAPPRRRVGSACGTPASGPPASGTPASGTPASGERPPDTPPWRHRRPAGCGPRRL